MVSTGAREAEGPAPGESSHSSNNLEIRRERVRRHALPSSDSESDETQSDEPENNSKMLRELRSHNKGPKLVPAIPIHELDDGLFRVRSTRNSVARLHKILSNEELPEPKSLNVRQMFREQTHNTNHVVEEDDFEEEVFGGVRTTPRAGRVTRKTTQQTRSSVAAQTTPTPRRSRTIPASSGATSRRQRLSKPSHARGRRSRKHSDDDSDYIEGRHAGRVPSQTRIPGRWSRTIPTSELAQYSTHRRQDIGPSSLARGRHAASRAEDDGSVYEEEEDTSDSEYEDGDHAGQKLGRKN